LIVRAECRQGLPGDIDGVGVLTCVDFSTDLADSPLQVLTIDLILQLGLSFLE